MRRDLRGAIWRPGEPVVCGLEWTLPEEWGPAEAWPGRKAGTDEVCEGIPEGFRPVEPVRVAPEARKRRDTGHRLRGRMLFH